MAEIDDWVIAVKEELQRMDTIQSVEIEQRRFSICRVPAMRVQNIKVYNPQYVSFGPYHHGQDHLKPMEEHKRRALLNFLRISKKPPEYYMDSLAKVAQTLKDSYESLDDWQFDTKEFLQMMIVDGCFMIEVLGYIKNITKYGYAHSDPIFRHHGKLYIATE